MKRWPRKLTRRKKNPAKTLPPTENSIILHLLRFVYQMSTWLQAMNAMQELADPTDFGYEINEDKTTMRSKMKNQSVAAPEL